MQGLTGWSRLSCGWSSIFIHRCGGFHYHERAPKSYRCSFKGFSAVDCDACLFGGVGNKGPVKFLGGEYLRRLAPKVCDGDTCRWLAVDANGKPSLCHVNAQKGHNTGAKRRAAESLPVDMVEYVASLRAEANVVVAENSAESTTTAGGERTKKEEVLAEEADNARQIALLKIWEEVRFLGLDSKPWVTFGDSEEESMTEGATRVATVGADSDDEDEEEETARWEIVRRIFEAKGTVAALKGAIATREPLENQLVEECKAKLLEEFKDTSLAGCVRGTPWSVDRTVKLKYGSSPEPSRSAYRPTGSRASEGKHMQIW